jgi:hypothetical protein
LKPIAEGRTFAGKKMEEKGVKRLEDTTMQKLKHQLPKYLLA